MEAPFVLLVEDNADDVTLMLRISAHGVLGDEAGRRTGGVKALDFRSPRRGWRPRWHPLPRVISRLKPGIDGLGVLRRVRGIPDEVPSVSCSRRDEERDGPSYRLGAKAYRRGGFHPFSETMGALGRYWFQLNRRRSRSRRRCLSRSGCCWSRTRRTTPT